MTKKNEQSDKKIEKFKADYAAIKVQVKLIKQKLQEVKKMAKPISKVAHRLYWRGDKTMYNEKKGRIMEAKFAKLPGIMADLEVWMDIDDNIQHAIEYVIGGCI